MKRKDLIALVIAAGVTAVVSFVISIVIFSPPKHTATVPIVQPISNSMPDIKNDANYNTIFNNTALDPAPTVDTGTNQNNAPFRAGT